MTNFYAVYLFIIIAIVLLAMGLYFKRGWLHLLLWSVFNRRNSLCSGINECQ